MSKKDLQGFLSAVGEVATYWIISRIGFDFAYSRAMEVRGGIITFSLPLSDYTKGRLKVSTVKDLVYKVNTPWKYTYTQFRDRSELFKELARRSDIIKSAEKQEIK
jgi:hypothetical protein